MKSPLIKSKIPFASNFQSIEDAFNYMAKVINSSKLPESEGSSTVINNTSLAEGGNFSKSSTTAGVNTIVTSTVVHNLGYVPRCAMITGVVSSANHLGSIYFNNFTTTTVDINVYVETAQTVDVYFFLLK